MTDNAPSSQSINEQVVRGTTRFSQCKRRIQICVGIAFWVGMCAPSNIVALYFYFKPIDALATDVSYEQSSNTNRTNEILDVEHNETLRSSSPVPDQVSQKHC